MLAVWVFLLFSSLLFTTTSTTQHTCDSPETENCEDLTSEYDKYRTCMEKRTKRSADCYGNDSTDCDSCDCDSCGTKSCNSCNTNCCKSCCQNSCSSYNCCHKTCRADCRSNSCRSACKKSCLERQLAGQNGEVSVNNSHSILNRNEHNITTVIHLNNLINNTNYINLPINLNNTVLNNITNEGGSYGGFYTGETGKNGESCCSVIGPKQCVSQREYPHARCFHLKKKACGSICLAPVMHLHRHKVCENEVTQEQPCKEQNIYIPQPSPRCAYKATWPYVSCGNQESSCEGCYSHYIKRQDIPRCSSFCYDDGYGVGPYYRQGPFYRPGFAHTPSCLQTGYCPQFDTFSQYQPQPAYGYPSGYPPESYPFLIEDCKNCPVASNWNKYTPEENVLNFNYGDGYPTVQWVNNTGELVKIDAAVEPTLSDKYAQIEIKSSEDVADNDESSTLST